MMNVPTTRDPDRRPGDPVAELDHGPGDLVAEHRRRGEGDFALDHMEIGVADAAGCHLDEDLAPPGPRDGNPLNLERHPRGRKHRCQHRLRHLPGQLNPSVPAGLC